MLFETFHKQILIFASPNIEIATNEAWQQFQDVKHAAIQPTAK